MGGRTVEAPVQPPGADRRRPDRLLDRARRARAGRRAGDRRHRALGGDPQARGRARLRRQGRRHQRRGGEGRRPRHRLHPGRRLRRGRGRDRAASQAPAPSSPTSARSRARWCAIWRLTCPPASHFVPAHPVAGTEYSGPDAGFAELFVNRWCILTPPEGTDPAATERLAGVLALVRRQGRDHDRRPPRPGAGGDQPPAAPDRLHHRRHRVRIARGDAVGGAEVLRRRLPRFHPHRVVGPDHVARHLPRQQGRGAGDARALHRGRVANSRAQSDAATARRCSTSSPSAAPSAAASSRWARISRPRISAGRIRNCRRNRCRDRMRRTRISKPADFDRIGNSRKSKCAAAWRRRVRSSSIAEELHLIGSVILSLDRRRLLRWARQPSCHPALRPAPRPAVPKACRLPWRASRNCR